MLQPHMGRGHRLRARTALTAGLIVLAAVLAAAAWVQRSKPDLSRWHKVILESEFEADDAEEGFSWPEYLALEDRLFGELEERVVRRSDGGSDPSWCRYADGGVNNPAGFPRNWNRSYEMPASPGADGALLIHGLTDSPYSLRRTAEILNANGYYVVGIRLPGHGTTPSALLDARVEDWRAAVRIAYRHLSDRVGPEHEAVVVGYSNGGALALDLVLDSLANPSLRTPGRVVLFSPAVGITKAAALAPAHHLLSWLPWFDRLGWKDIEPEFDPFKYNSFPTDAGYETHVLTRSVRKRLAGLKPAAGTSELPPVLTFMSLADATVLVEAVVEGLYDRLDGGDDELVIFDINRQAKMLGFFRIDPSDRLRALIDRPVTPYRLTLITNVDGTSPALEEWSRPAGGESAEVRDLDLAWPRGVYSLSHVALPFPADDPIYGTEPGPDGLFGVALGTIEPRGERGLLAVPADQLLRLRSNPFHSYVEGRLVETFRH